MKYCTALCRYENDTMIYNIMLLVQSHAFDLANVISEEAQVVHQ
jgi:hypothetical protein